MENKLFAAIQNNNDLYEAVFSQWDIPYHSNDEIWYCVDEIPPLYSNIVTRSPRWRPDLIYTQVDQAAKERGENWSIKDSFAVLDLRDRGFAKLFEAKWIYLQRDEFRPISITHHLSYKTITSEADLSTWRLAWDADEHLGENIFTSSILKDPKVNFIAGYQDESLVSGCVANKGNTVLGISNFFSPIGELTYWSDLLSFIVDCYREMDIVGYEGDELVNQLKRVGIKPLGSLIVWLKTRVG